MAPGRSTTACACLALATIALALAACTSTPPPRELAGHYELAGVMEMGSQLLLNEQGSFEAVLYYGNLDIHARGRWSMVDEQVELAVRPKPSLPRETLELGAIRHTDPSTEAHDNGHYRLGSFSMSVDVIESSLEVRWVFDDGSEQRTVWSASVFEDLILPMRADSALKRLGVRAAGSGARFEWLEVRPGERHFSVMRTLHREGEPRAFFHEMRLTPRGNCLLVDMGTATGCYRRR